MIQPTQPSEAVRTPNGRLSGWKEISAYLGKSVRTAQRWEKELSLPVRRIHTEGGEIVFAFREEIDGWLAGFGPEGPAHCKEMESRDESQQQGPGEPATATVTPVAPAAPATVPSALFRRRPFAWLIAAASLVILGLLSLLGAGPSRLFGGPPPQPVSWKVEGGLLKVFDSGGNHLWDRNFGRPLLDALYALDGGPPREKSAFIADLDGDGTQEVGIILRTEPGPQAGFQVLNHDGSLRFAVQPGYQMQFGDALHAPPWYPAHLLLTDEPDGSKSVWVVYIHNLWFPSLLQKLDPQGKVLGEYWSNGHIEALHEGVYQGRRAMLVGATNNENFAASLAVLDYHNPSGFAPAAQLKYRCANCPAGAPLAFFIFPATELSRIANFRPVGRELRTDGMGNFILNVQQAPLDPALGNQGASAYYVLSPTGRIVEGETADSHRLLHSNLETHNRLHHRFGPACEKQLFPVLRWDHQQQRFVPEYGKLANPPR